MSSRESKNVAVVYVLRVTQISNPFLFKFQESTCLLSVEILNLRTTYYVKRKDDEDETKEYSVMFLAKTLPEKPDRTHKTHLVFDFWKERERKLLT